MVGIGGIVGESSYGLESLETTLTVADDEVATTSTTDRAAVHLTSHPQFHEEQPATAADGARVWLYGSVYGSEGPAGYTVRDHNSTTTAAYCAELYDDRGLDFVADLNGEFAGLILDQSANEAHLFTDRIGSIPLFYTRTDDALLFSSRLQAVGLHPGVTPTFDRDSLSEYFAVQKAFGTATVLDDVAKVHPGSILTVDLEGTVTGRDVYWRPEYRPVDRSPAELARKIADTMTRVFAERLRDDLEYGVMLSGGSDSRLVLGSATDQGRSPTAFHLTNWMSRETAAAERVAETAGAEFEVLQRDEEYHAELLEQVPAYSNFVGPFDEFIASGFAAELDEVDVLLTGYLGDTMFGRYPFYLRNSRLPFTLPIERSVESIPDYVELYLDRYTTRATVPDFLDTPPISDVLLDRIESTAAGVRHHGVEYRSLRELQLCEYYPLTNQYASANTDSIRQITGHWSPFFDNRLLDLHLSIPVRDRIRRDPINMALTEHSPSLAAIPHGWSGVPPAKSRQDGPQLLVRKSVARLRNRLTEDSPPEPFLGHRPWIDEEELIRNHDFIERAIERHSDLIAALPFLDRDEIDRCYHDHLSGANNWRELYTLVTLLESPIASRIGSENSP